MKKIALVLLTLGAVACSGGGASSDEATPTALVTLAKAFEGPISEMVTLYGAAEAGPTGKQVIVAQADSVVTKIIAPEGSKVSKGDKLAILSLAPAPSLDLAKARADAKTADAAYARAKRLRADGLASDAHVENTRANAESGDATLHNLENRMDGLVLRAPVDGYVSDFTVKLGDQLSAGAPIVTIGGGGDIRARFGLDPVIARVLKPGMPIVVRSSGDQGAFGEPSAETPSDPPGDPEPDAVTNTIQSVYPLVDPQTRLASAYANLPPSGSIAIGELLIGRVMIGRIKNAVIIPYAALLNGGGQTYVFVVTEGVAHRHNVELGPVNGDHAAINKGVAAGDDVVAEGGTGVEDGMKVRTE